MWCSHITLVFFNHPIFDPTAQGIPVSPSTPPSCPPMPRTSMLPLSRGQATQPPYLSRTPPDTPARATSHLPCPTSPLTSRCASVVLLLGLCPSSMSCRASVLPLRFPHAPSSHAPHATPPRLPLPSVAVPPMVEPFLPWWIHYWLSYPAFKSAPIPLATLLLQKSAYSCLHPQT